MSPTVALTFDDGPDPRWTPAVLDALRAADAPATFFVFGPCAAAHPALVARMRAEGHAVGVHAHEHTRTAPTGDAVPAGLIQPWDGGAVRDVPVLERPPLAQLGRDVGAARNLGVLGAA